MFKRLKRKNIISTVAFAATLITVFSSLFSCQSQKNEFSNDPICATSYNDVYKTIREAIKYQDSASLWGIFYNGGNPKNENSLDFANSGTAGAPGSSSIEHSDTNVQVEGVMEADIVKTDGQYIYTLSRDYNTIFVVSANDGVTEVVSKISFDKNLKTEIEHPEKEGETLELPLKKYASEMYIYGDRLIVTGSIIPSYDYDDYTISDIKAIESYMYQLYTEEMFIDVIDISEKSAPKSIENIRVPGYEVSTRMIDNKLYLVSQFRVRTENDTKLDEDNLESYIPYVITNSKKTFVSADSIMINSNPDMLRYSLSHLVITAFDISGTPEIISSASLLGYGSQIYASKNAIYVTNSYYEYANYDINSSSSDEVSVIENSQKTIIFKYDITDGEVSYSGYSKVPGQILNQFSLDEYNGVLRIVTTLFAETTSNALYTLDENMNILGKIENLAPSERIYSVRFDGDIGYFVTFRRIDPLFTVDLSEPKAPKILSELKIPGFSDYLQVYSDGLLFGLGQDPDSSSMKISMFDTSDKSNVREAATEVLSKYYTSEANYNHKAILVNRENNIIAFPATLKDSYRTVYLIFSYDEASNEFKEMAIVDVKEENRWSESVRGLFIEDWMYVITNKSIASVSLDSYETYKTTSLVP